MKTLLNLFFGKKKKPKGVFRTRHVTKSMIEELKMAFLISDDNMIFSTKLLRDKVDTSTGNITLFKHYGIIEQVMNADEVFLGYWKITKKGVDFINGRIDIPENVIIYNDKLQGFSGRKIWINT